MYGLSRSIVEESLRACGLAWGVLELQDGVEALLVARGGRVLGPFLPGQSGSLFWLNPALGSAETLRAFLAAREWNLGGERLWISPEIQWLVRDRQDFWGTIHIPAAYDPGAYELDPTPDGGWRLRVCMTLQAYNLATGVKTLAVERAFRPVPDPLRYAAGELPDGVTYAGYEQAVTLSEVAAQGAPPDAITAQSWVLIQVHAGGSMLVPASPDLTLTDYNEPIDAAHCARAGHFVAFRITGARRYKVGMRAAHTFGRLGYFSSDGTRATLIVRAFLNNPSSVYSEEPAHLPGARGDSIHIYNDGGTFGGFGELEVQGQTIGGETGLSSVRDQMLLWIYAGPAAGVARVCRHLLGIDPLSERSLKEPPMA